MLSATISGPLIPPAASAPTAAPFPQLRDRAWDPLLLALAAYICAAVGRVHQLFAFLLPLKPLLLSSACAVALFFLLPGSRAGRDPHVVLRAGPLRWMGALLVWALLSVPGALWVGGAYATAVDVLLKAVVMAIVIGGAIRGVRDAERLAAVYFGSVALYAVIVLMRFQVGGGEWRLGHLYYYDANDFATIAVTALPFGVYFARFGSSIWGRVAAAAGAAAIITAFAWTGSRGGFVAAIVLGLFFLVGYSSIALRWRVTAVGALVLLLIAGASDDYWKKMESLIRPGDDYNLESQEGRKAIWQRGMGYMLQHPVLGVGAGNFPTAEGTISPRASRQSVGRGVKWQAAHNSYVQVGAELGFPGLFCFLAMIFTALGSVLRSARPATRSADPLARRRRALAQTVAGALISFVTGAVFLSLAYVEALYVLVALAAGLRRVPEW